MVVQSQTLSQKNPSKARRGWLTPAILATQEAEIRRIEPAQANSSQDPISKKPITKKGQVEWFKV
jgi:hypothetical protein